MTSLIINLPHLQSRRQRHGAMLLSILCWVWFIMPLAIVGGWLMGFHVLAQEVVWLGGWRSLVRLAEVAVMIVAAIAAVWTLWTLVEIRAERRETAAPATLAQSGFGVDDATLGAAKAALVTTVYFTDTGGIAEVVPGSAGALGEQRRAA